MTKPVVRVKAGDGAGDSARLMATVAVPRSAYAAADQGHQSLAGWMPPMQSADAEWLRDRDVSVSRIRDLERNDGWVSAGIDRQVDMLVGGALRLNSKPDADALGISHEAAHELGRSIQTVWRDWADDPIFRSDAERQQTFSGLAGMAAREFVGIGEALGVLRWKERAGWDFRTALHMVDPDRLSNPYGQPDSEFLRKGVAKDEDAAPIGYWIRRGHPSDVFGMNSDPFTWDYFERWHETELGWQRPGVVHLYDKRRPGQSRGVSRLVANLVKTRMLSRYSESEVRTAAINASIIGAIYTQLGSEYAAERLGNDDSNVDWSGFNTQRAEFYKNRQVLDEARFLTLFPTDKLEMNTEPRQTAGYPAFQRAFLQGLSTSLGISYEQLSMDWSQTNYSSARAALNEVWRGVQRLRSILIWGFAMPIFAAVLEDALDRELVDVPRGCADFYERPAAWLRSQWIGPGRGFIDPVKEAQASALRRAGRISTLEREAAEQGEDWEFLLEQIAREDAEFARLSVDPPSTDTKIMSRTDLGNDQRPD
ncbi:phage portal protein [Pelagibacterium montanilacus]|uniref:phage portal protein n=1 Tax=Pelagibacterium montanilacus TaxID=2185280 RepID=UPI000F8EE22B|nr:phage portal protein [Pelagibacterium montanilacus]